MSQPCERKGLGCQLQDLQESQREYTSGPFIPEDGSIEPNDREEQRKMCKTIVTQKYMTRTKTDIPKKLMQNRHRHFRPTTAYLCLS